jgi:hypothetical protein
MQDAGQRKIFSRWQIIAFCLFFSTASAAVQPSFTEFRTYSDPNGQLYLEAPKDFVLIATEVNIPLIVSKKYGYLKITQTPTGWGLEPVTYEQWKALQLTEGHPFVVSANNTEQPDKVSLNVVNQPFSVFVVSGLNSVFSFSAFNSDGTVYDPADITRQTIYNYDSKGRLLSTTKQP